MILIDSVYINCGGAKILLDYFIDTIENTEIPAYYLFDDRCKGNYAFIPESRKTFIKANLVNRHLFYSKNKNKFNKVFCFGNLAPTIFLDIPVYTYFHQTLFLELPKSLSTMAKLKIKFKSALFAMLKGNTNIWLVQSEIIRNKLASKYNLRLDNIKTIPFFPPLKNTNKKYDRRKDGFVYISLGGIHKNHQNLINAFCNYYDVNKKGILHITISKEFPDLLYLIQEKVQNGYPLVNHGVIARDALVEIYNTNQYLIYPSLAESFGLGIVEAIENGCNVIGADLPYTYAVCIPSIVFDPLDINDIKRAFTLSQSDHVKKTEQLVFNKIEELLSMLR